MTRSLADKVHDRARSKAMEEIVLIYPRLWDQLFSEHLNAYRQPEHEVYQHFAGRNNKIYDAARRDAVMVLKGMFPGSWQLLIWSWSKHFKTEMGYIDGRAESNRERSASTVRGEGGRFARAQ